MRALASAAVFTAVLVFRPLPAPAFDRQLHHFNDVTIAPDGSRVVAIESTEAPVEGDPSRSDLVVRRISDGTSTTVALPCAPDPDCEPSYPTWSPNGKQVAFILKVPKSSHRALYEVDANGTNLRRVLDFDGSLIEPHYSPAGDHLAVLATAGAHKEIGATQPGEPIVGIIGESTDEQRIAVVGRDGTFVYASPPNLFVYEYDWLPAGGFVGTAAHGNGDNNWWIARLYAFEPTDASARVIATPADAQMQIANPRVSPDGRFVAFIGGLMSDFGSTGGDVYTVELNPAKALPAIDVTPNVEGSATSIAWACPTAGAPRLDMIMLRGGNVTLESIDAEAPTAIVRLRSFGETSVSNRTIACSGVQSYAFVRQSFGVPPEIFVAAKSNAAPKQLTHENDGLVVAGAARSVTWPSNGAMVHGWLLTPTTTTPSTQPRPLILEIHGGPAASWTPRFIGRGTARELLRAGYDLFLPNPRGSFGDGEKFTRANVKDFGYGDLRDDLAGIDAVEKLAPVDDTRLGVTGGSYGGYMSMWAVTQTHRFKAAVALAGISDWISYYGENGIDEWMIPYFGASAYDDPAVYRKSSPIEFIKGVTTPSLIMVGERDVECPAPQSQEFWHALTTLGVPTQLVIYAGEGHRFRQPKDLADATDRTLTWFAKYLNGST